ncbi:RNA polymerase II nuclear localization protein Iwr1p [Trichomonascus vanleenenianus]|uniref:Iwr1p n=1 Tax=Trichomonascus vanleenenianus TaxID=2268995 RepID=UPI003ECA24A9
MELMDTSPDIHLPPHTVRIKRKRGEDPLQALLVDDSNIQSTKRSKTSTPNGSNYYVFKLAGTFDTKPSSELDIVLQQQEEGRVFKIPKSRKGYQALHNDPEVAKSLTDMVQSYLELEAPPKIAVDEPLQQNEPQAEPHKQGVVPESTITNEDIEIEDYVYDIYYRYLQHDDPAAQLTGLKVGFIMLDSDDDFFIKEDSDSNQALTDDEDSNAEDFYKNDYPEEDEARSASEFDSEEEMYVRGFDTRKLDVAEMREGRSYFNINRFQDDEDDFNNSDEDEDGGSMDGIHSRREELEWSEDEDLEEYRSRVLGELDARLRD